MFIPSLRFHSQNISTIRYKLGSNAQYEVWTDTGSHKLFSADNAAEAKYKYLLTLLPKETDPQ
jgi:hypothetical protein